MKKTDVDKLLKKYQPTIKKTGKQMSKIVKVAEEDISKLYRIAHTYVEMQMKNIQKEKLYHEIGKDISDKILSGKLEIPELDEYKKRLSDISSKGSKMKKKLSRITRINKTKKKNANKK